MTTASSELHRDSRGARARAVPSVLAVVVTHNGRPWLRECLASLNVQTHEQLDVLVVDDASPDTKQRPHLKRIVKRHLRRRRWGYVRTPRPLGFGGAINWALARVTSDAQFLLFLHDDAALTPDSVEKMVARMRSDESAGIVGPKIVSWHDADRLEEVGMAIDRFGFPYKGLEDDEIDIGQHDSSSEVFFVTSTCLLVRSGLFRQLKGWDARMRAFSEDLDLCWRARVLGHTVRYEPAAKARHAIALATGQRRSPFLPVRYFSRRNRLRAVTKNASGVRLLMLLPFFVALTVAEMIGFVVLRQPREIWNLARALGWNLLRFPQTIAERTRVQLNRKIPDRRLSPLMIRVTSRVRFYIQSQTGRLEEAWGRRAEYFATRSLQMRTVGRRVRGRPALIGFAALIAALLAFRHYIWGSPAAAGELLPYPPRASALWHAFVSPWQEIGLGQPGPPTPALLPLGTFPFLTLGSEGAAQKLLLLSLAILAFAGAYRLVSDLVDRWGRVAAGVVYTAGSLGYAGMRAGALGALVFGAMAPFALRALLHLSGWVRPAGWNPGREIARVALAAAVSAAFVPGSLFLYLIVAFVLAGARQLLSPGSRALRSVIASAAALLVGWLLLLPWSSTWWQEGAPLARLTGDATWGSFAQGFEDHGMTSVLLGQTPDSPALFGLALPLFGLIATLVGQGQRRRVALALCAVVGASGLLVAFFATGAVRPFVASPVEAGVLPALAFAALTGLAVGAFRLDLSRRGLGAVHGLAVTGMAVGLFLVVVGMTPAIWQGRWAPVTTPSVVDGELVAEVRSLLAAEAATEGVREFRALWIGDGWTPGGPSAARPTGARLVTGEQGQVLTDLFHRDYGGGEEQLETAVASIEAGATDRGGNLLGAFNIRFVVLQSGPSLTEWLQQRDLAVIRSSPEYLLLENRAEPLGAGIYAQTPPYVRALAEADSTLGVGAAPDQRATLGQISPSHYESDGAAGPAVAFVPESGHNAWRAYLEGAALPRAEGGWANAFTVGEGDEGPLEVRFERPASHYLMWVLVGLGWIVVLGAVFSRRREPSGAAP